MTRRGRVALVAAGIVVAVTAAAVPLLALGGGGDTEPASLVVPEGRRAARVYESIDKALDLEPGTTRRSVAAAELELPEEADGNPEGYLFPGTYPLGGKPTPEKMLTAMVDRANKAFRGAPVAAGAQRNALDVYQAVTIASIVQTEAATKDDMGKVARVILNRLERGMPLQMDSTLNYALGRPAHAPTTEDTGKDSPYDSYRRMGLPPTPIAGPGADAMRAAVEPAPGDWLYFVTVRPGDTRFTADLARHRRDLEESDRARRSASPGEEAAAG
ncbi:endolytic transglycosylase MltG [Streptomyces sp. SID8352]|uniref:endolytic transglycosylase MltG n=1 Tax=Streptomyces sp. SID8352 TaxID=2690338 RepID=UPI0019288444|nr:endolytic transglycosylase MltG [Streptomyces sp. SID8352]